MKLKIGDTVRIIEVTPLIKDSLGKYATIKDISYTLGIMYLLHDMNGKRLNWYFQSELELAKNQIVRDIINDL